MFQGLLRRAESTIDQVVAKYMSRAMVAIPLLVAGGFATAALTVKLVELYGSVTGYGLMAALFGVIGLVTMAIVGTGERRPAEPATAEQPAAASAEQPSSDAIDAAELLTPEVRALLASVAPMAVPGLIRGVGRNLPLIFFLALVGFLISGFTGSPEEGTDASEGSSSAPPEAEATAPSVSAAAAAA